MPVDDIGPWQDATGRKSLSWFGLTMGWFWIQAGEQELFRYADDLRLHWNRKYPDFPLDEPPYEDYQIARYWEDLLTLLSYVLDPLPADLAVRVADKDGWEEWLNRSHDWRETQEDSETWEQYQTATWWWHRRSWDAGHLQNPPYLWLWRVEDTVHLRWDNRSLTVDGFPVWTATVGEITLPVSDFMAAVQSFHDRFLDAMAERVAQIQAGWNRPEIAIDLPQLAQEQQERREWLSYAIDPWAITQRRGADWDEVRDALRHIEREVPQPDKP